MNDPIVADIMRSISLDVPDNVDEFADPEDIKRIRDASEFADDVVAQLEAPPEKTGAPMPWGSTSREIYFRPGEMSVWSGDSGLGKSAMLMQCMCGLLYREKALIISPEMPVVTTLTRAASQLCGTSNPTPEYAREQLMKLCGKLYMYDQTGELEDRRTLGVLRWAQENYGLTQFVVDSLMMIEMTNVRDGYNRAEGRFARSLSNFARDAGVHVHLVAHQRKSHGYGKKDKDDVEGSGKITKMASNVFFLEADEKKQEESELPPNDQNADVMRRPDLYLTVKKVRNAAKPKGAFPFWIHPSFQFLDTSSGRPLEIV